MNNAANNKNTKAIQTIFYAVLLAILFFIHLRLYTYGFDDAYIHFRIVRNFLDTGLPYFNSAEYIKASTSSGWILLLTPVLFITRLFRAENSFPLIVSCLNALFTFGGLLVYTRIFKLLYSPKENSILIWGFQICYIALIAPSSIGMMETPCALFIAGLGIYFVLRSQKAGFILLGCALFMRAEMVILLFFITMLVLLRKDMRLVDPVLFTAMGMAPFIAFDLYFYHTVLPHSITAKSIVYTIKPADTFSKIVFSFFPALPFIKSSPLAFALNITLWISLAYGACRTLVAQWMDARRLELALFIGWGLALSALYIFKHILVFEWYMPLYSIPLLIAAAASAINWKTGKNALPVAAYFGLCLVCLYSLGQMIEAGAKSPAEFSLFESGSRVKMYRKVSQALNSEYPNATLLSSEIGGLGFEFRGKILDAAGLVSPDALQYHPMAIPGERQSGDLGAIPPQYVAAHLPELIVSYDIFSVALLHSKVAENYNIIKIPAYLPEDASYTKMDTIWGSKYLRVFIRKDLPVSEKLLAFQSK